MTNARGATEGFLGDGKGILEILANPWNEEKAMFFVEGWDEWGITGGSATLANNHLPQSKLEG